MGKAACMTVMLLGSACTLGDDTGATAQGTTSSTGSGSTAGTAASDTSQPIGTTSSSSGAADETFGCPLRTYYPDGDSDGFGDEAFPVQACIIPPAHVEAGGDCDDENPEVHPDAPETCNGIDDDCNGWTDEASADNPSCQGCSLLVDGASAYAFCPGAMTWDAAVAHCALFAGTLVSVGDEAEHALIVGQGLRGPAVYIGLNDVEIEGVFVWPDGSPLGFEAWGEGEPNDALKGEDCVQVSVATGLWNDITCTSAAAFVCEATAE